MLTPKAEHKYQLPPPTDSFFKVVHITFTYCQIYIILRRVV